MKKSKFFAFAALGMLLASCSSDDNVTQEPVATGDGYLSVSINLPTTSSTRAQNDVYDDGLPKEYNVSDMKLLLFQGTTEAAATYWQTIILGDQAGVDDVDNDNITTTYHKVGKVNGTTSDQLWALVMINTNGVTMPELTVGTTKIADLQGFANNNSFVNDENIFMTNAVLSSAAGGTAETAPTKNELQVLTQLNSDCIKPTAEEAKNNPAGSIFVERAVAKATLKVDASKVGTYDIKETKWVLDNTQNNSYLVRNMGELETDYMGYSSGSFKTPNYRFAGDTKIGETAIQPTVNLYRTYWCIDPVYDTDAARDNMTSALNVTGETGIDNPQYCKENTFDVAHQTYKNTTRAIIKVVLNAGVTFYSINGAQIFDSQDDAKAKLKEVFITNAGVVNALKASLNEGASYTIGENTFTFTFATDANGLYKLTNATLTDEAKANFDAAKLATNFTEEVCANAYKIANENYVVREYKDGVMYYTARFQHFADDLAPWNTWESDPKPAMGTTANVYPGTNAEQNYLGRYGMVRNNWYDVTVTEFKKFGDPVIPSVDIDTPDDNINDQYISVKINVLAWAKRTQNWSF